ncbi:uncharacterized protein ARB_02023 [Trichophyton benhamiae CBS 112371]|uniref:Uncharacterized protein n=1 Tax=Arthroderma benhamiae (strain ATCC MYA-4681 / CBS 112371) TaxID=663331 RepID=D4B0P7_ARTBC|nr:uncharacterized protein ARB_02023 [Trichophyton benhamiae CBS 112371]EFE31154.1 hypothetical protein ARB_02023 [Trichophyton benhamiae CBS 112371]
MAATAATRPPIRPRTARPEARQAVTGGGFSTAWFQLAALDSSLWQRADGGPSSQLAAEEASSGCWVTGRGWLAEARLGRDLAAAAAAAASAGHDMKEGRQPQLRRRSELAMMAGGGRQVPLLLTIDITNSVNSPSGDGGKAAIERPTTSNDINNNEI